MQHRQERMIHVMMYRKNIFVISVTFVIGYYQREPVILFFVVLLRHSWKSLCINIKPLSPMTFNFIDIMPTCSQSLVYLLIRTIKHARQIATIFSRKRQYLKKKKTNKRKAHGIFFSIPPSLHCKTVWAIIIAIYV